MVDPARQPVLPYRLIVASRHRTRRLRPRLDRPHHPRLCHPLRHPGQGRSHRCLMADPLQPHRCRLGVRNPRPDPRQPHRPARPLTQPGASGAGGAPASANPNPRPGTHWCAGPRQHRFPMKHRLVTGPDPPHVQEPAKPQNALTLAEGHGPSTQPDTDPPEHQLGSTDPDGREHLFHHFPVPSRDTRSLWDA